MGIRIPRSILVHDLLIADIKALYVKLTILLNLIVNEKLIHGPQWIAELSFL